MQDQTTQTLVPSAVDAEWLEFAYKVLPKNAGITQMRETRIAFFAGALSVLNNLENMANNGKDEDENVGGLIAMFTNCEQVLTTAHSGGCPHCEGTGITSVITVMPYIIPHPSVDLQSNPELTPTERNWAICGKCNGTGRVV